MGYYLSYVRLLLLLENYSPNPRVNKNTIHYSLILVLALFRR